MRVVWSSPYCCYFVGDGRIIVKICPFLMECIQPIGNIEMGQYILVNLVLDGGQGKILFRANGHYFPHKHFRLL
jgi:hypothetical protein